jgi:hypothetical protein
MLFSFNRDVLNFNALFARLEYPLYTQREFFKKDFIKIMLLIVLPRPIYNPIDFFEILCF